MKCLVIGLDCAAPQLVFEQWREELPTLRGLMTNGAYGRLQSTHPPITVPAWSCMMSSRDPGELGFYGFRNRKDYSYDGYALANSTAVSYDRGSGTSVGQKGKRSILLGVPQTYPRTADPREMVTCFLTPSTKSRVHLPPELKDEVERVSGGYILDVEDFRTRTRRPSSTGSSRRPAKHFKMAKHLHAPPRLGLLHDGGDGGRPHPSWLLEIPGPDAPQVRAGQPLRGRDPRLLPLRRRGGRRGARPGSCRHCR